MAMYILGGAIWFTVLGFAAASIAQKSPRRGIWLFRALTCFALATAALVAYLFWTLSGTAGS